MSIGHGKLGCAGASIGQRRDGHENARWSGTAASGIVLRSFVMVHIGP
jgi:hypothetical protein